MCFQIGNAQYNLTWTQSSKFQGGFNPAYWDADKEVGSIAELYEDVEPRFSIDLSTRFPPTTPGFVKQGPGLAYLQGVMDTRKYANQNTSFQIGLALSAENTAPLSLMEVAIQPVVHKKLGKEGQFIRLGFNLGFAQYAINKLNPRDIGDPQLQFTDRSVLYGRIGGGVYWHHQIRNLTWEHTQTHLFFGASISGIEVFNPDRSLLNVFSFSYSPLIQVSAGVIQTINEPDFIKLSGLYRNIKGNPGLIQLAAQYNYAIGKFDIWTGPTFRFGNFEMLGWEIGAFFKLDNVIFKWSLSADFWLDKTRSPLGTMLENRMSGEF